MSRTSQDLALYTKKNSTYKKRKRSWQDKKMMTLARIAAQKLINSNQELKRKIYDYSAIGIDPVGGAAVSFGSVSYGSSSAIAQIGRGIVQGTTDDDRIGLAINVKKIRVNFAIQNGDNLNHVRVLLMKNKGRYSTSSTASCIQSILSGEASGATQWLADVDTSYWKVYLDEKLFLRTIDATGGAGAAETKIISKTIRFPGKGIKLEWDTQNISPAEDFVLAMLSDSAAVSHPGCIAGKLTVYYTDA